MKIAYIKEWGKDGTCYRQRITVNGEEFAEIDALLTLKYNEEMQKIGHLITSEQAKILHFRKPLTKTEHKDNKYYLSLTQLYFIESHFYNKRITDNNTILLVTN